MKEYKSLASSIKNKEFSPIYFLEGEEPFYIDRITDLLEANILSEEEKGFNQTITYGSDTDLDQIISLAKQFPMGAEKQVVIVKEAQKLDFTKDKSESLANYITNIQPSTILIFNYKYKKLDKRLTLTKALDKAGFVYRSDKLYDNQVPAWIGDTCKSMGMSIDEKSKVLLAEFLGNNISGIYNELSKLKIILGDTKNITPELIEENIGISKEYNNFELRKAIVEKNVSQAYKIIDYFDKNPKTSPIVLTFGTLISLFSNMIIVHTLSDKSSASIAKALKINPFFTSEYTTAIRNYPLKKTTACISILRDADMKSKGLGSSSQSSQKDILMEMLYKIFN